MAARNTAPLEPPDAEASARAQCAEENDARRGDWTRAWMTSSEAAAALDGTERAVWHLGRAGDVRTASQSEAPRRWEVVRGFAGGHVAIVESALPAVFGIRWFSRSDVLQIITRLSSRKERAHG